MRIPREPPVSPISLFSTRNTSRLNASVTKANHGPCTRSAGNPTNTLMSMHETPAMAMATRNGRFGNVMVDPANGDLAAGVEQHRHVGADAEECRLGQRHLAGEPMDEVRSDADDPEHGEQPEVEQRRVGATDGEHGEEGEASGQRRPLDDSTGPRSGRPTQVESEEGDGSNPPHPHHPGELRSPEGQQHHDRGRQHGEGDHGPRQLAAIEDRHAARSVDLTRDGSGGGPQMVRSSATPNKPCGRHRITRISSSSGIASR